MQKPPKSILDRTFRYRDSASTDVTKTWRDARKRMDEEALKRAEIVKELPRIGKKTGAQ